VLQEYVESFGTLERTSGALVRDVAYSREVLKRLKLSCAQVRSERDALSAELSALRREREALLQASTQAKDHLAKKCREFREVQEAVVALQAERARTKSDCDSIVFRASLTLVLYHHVLDPHQELDRHVASELGDILISRKLGDADRAAERIAALVAHPPEHLKVLKLPGDELERRKRDLVAAHEAAEGAKAQVAAQRQTLELVSQRCAVAAALATAFTPESEAEREKGTVLLAEFAKFIDIASGRSAVPNRVTALEEQRAKLLACAAAMGSGQQQGGGTVAPTQGNPIVQPRNQRLGRAHGFQFRGGPRVASSHDKLGGAFSVTRAPASEEGSKSAGRIVPAIVAAARYPFRARAVSQATSGSVR
jgi:predicted  nucleic acid-binding Zn-ribbon protein